MARLIEQWEYSSVDSNDVISVKSASVRITTGMIIDCVPDSP